MPEQTGQKPESTVLTTRGGLEVELLNFGAALKSIQVPVGDERVNVLLSYTICSTLRDTQLWKQ